MNMFCKVKYLLIIYPLLLQIVTSELSKSVPVFIVDNERALSNLTPSKSPFATLNKIQFSDVVRDALRKSARVVIFVEETLSSEDISSRDKLGSPYYLLRQGLIDGSVKHYPSVDDPFRVLQNLFPMTEFNTFQLDSKTSKLRLYDSNIRHLYIFFKDGANVSRIDALREHDLIMREVHYVVKQRAEGPVLAFYTGKVNPNAVNRPEFRNSPFAWQTRRDVIWCRNSKAIVAVEGLRIMHKKKAIALPPTDLGEVACTYYWNRDNNPNEVTVAMPLTSYTLECRFTFTDVSWTLEHCHLRPATGPAPAGLRGGEGTHLNFRRTLRYANTFQYNQPFDFRGSDGDGVVLKKITVEVINQPGQTKFSLKQGDDEPPEDDDTPPPDEPPVDPAEPPVDPAEPPKDSPEETPSDTPVVPPNDTPVVPPDDTPVKPPSDTSSDTPSKPETPSKDKEEYFFTQPLLTCFFISSILISLLIYGFSSLASIDTNSRYDDPKGKPLMFAES